MPTAANLLKTIAGDTAPAAAPRADAETFATMLSVEEVASPENPAATGPEALEAEAAPQPALDLIAPLLAQQQVVPTVIVPQGGASTVTVPIVGQADPTATATVDDASAAPSPLVPSHSTPLAAALGVNRAEGHSTGPVQKTGSATANPEAIAPTTGRAGAPRLRSGLAESAGARIAIEVGAKGQSSAPIPSSNAETVAALETSADQPTAATVPAQAQAQAHANTPDRGAQAQPAVSAVIAATAEGAANDHQPGNGERQSETAAPAADSRLQGTTSFTLTDARSLLASLTAATGLATAAPAQAGAAQQLGEALAAQVLDLAGGSEWLEQLTQEIGRTADGSGPLRFRLTPESLGELRVEISQSDRGAIVRMTVATEAAQAALTDAQPRLTAEARAQGVRIAETQVDLAGSQQQDRESGRQQATPADQPLRAFRATASTHNPAEPAPSRPADRYA